MPSIDPAAYSSESIFQLELERIFSERLFIGTTADFPEVNSYKSLRLAKNAFTVRRTDVGFKSFNNVCLHRSALIDPLGSGQRPFRCGYHGWAYDNDGSLRVAPLTDEKCISRRVLSEYGIGQAGDLLFVGLNGSKPQLDKVEAALNQIGVPQAPPPPFHTDTLMQECNWKLLVENNIEGYHLSFVHPQSFIPAGFNTSSRYEWDSDEYTCWSACIPNENTSKLKYLQKLSAAATHDFRHAYVFPNLFLTTTNQFVGFRSYMIPLSAQRTILKWELFELPALLKLAPAVREEMKKEAIRFTATSLAEDKPLVESCQVGLSSIEPNLQLQPAEPRISRFHQYYSGRMQNV
ncbi:aromatic ring-hydroxylating oxygenase subunit alpha [Stenotrophobium rhamnosiphilum]|uniref:Rieske domain-containing protein n=1 Tax=Stenotrophobium rhamnosiphilum TaxID=2029166 RepID=A0A2T5MDL6_9GAMM|nr:SRPBCC family protein [Stenotrophobium rhamnosiphilum]PTU30666.1 hypothetical protein CJD38_14315 [Stenotrophobium rhamnosiphilum]